ncbi:SDR family NAD(P)-dependent oxidoreductase [Maritimibacter sp. DP1N21-5]|uniref:SDR family NAD(P)-dependent oxidoreductase n=1 Tax=Maritimibacter sp. DP1N21-5 TaxID=2836867 RepID=UPI001C47D019|nr:SDR family NAD(P)-dependent oxidoreductase [Maritimibacter sp. DP1N21-5]MBV7408626.1 SDR family NAD(P)-dependent oxidoreductase [Maritimibacter sp. DP1N21-5]
MKSEAFDWTPADMGDLTGQVAMVTGTTGLCVAIVEGLARAGARVIMCGRSKVRGRAVLDGIRARVPEADLGFRVVDLGDQASVRAFAEKAVAEIEHVDMLVLNAAVMAELGRSETTDGFEMMFGVNHLGHFAMVAGLMPLLMRSRARVVSLSSGAHQYGEFDFDDLMSTGKFKPMVAYGKTKLACLMFAKELDRRSKAGGWGITSVAAHPGFARTDGVFTRLATIPLLGWIAGKTVVPLLSHVPEKAAWSILFAATSPEVRGGGNYGPVGFRELSGPVGPATTADYAEREDVASRLWAESARLTGASFPPLAQTRESL